MIPLVWVLVLWLAGVTLFLILSLLTVTLALRFGVGGLRTFFFCGLYLAGSALIIGVTGIYAIQVDWSQAVSFTGPTFQPSDSLLFP